MITEIINLVGGGQDLTPYLFEEDAIIFIKPVKLPATNTILNFIQNIKKQ
jgi:coproporphyrinogen III oxidase